MIPIAGCQAVLIFPYISLFSLFFYLILIFPTFLSQTPYFSLFFYQNAKKCFFQHCILQNFPTGGDTPPTPTPYNILFSIDDVNIKKRISQGLPWHVYFQTEVRGSIFISE